ncbi:hypothetical protein Hpkin59_13090 [Helicobacter pylori]
MRPRTNKHSQTPFCTPLLDLVSSLIREKFYTIFINLKTKFKTFSLKKSPLPKNKAKLGLKFFPWIR